MQNQSNASANNFALMPMGAQQFYHMAQQHAVANAAFAPVVPAYLPLHEPDAYSSMVALGAYNLPQNMVQSQNAADGAPAYLGDAAWPTVPGFGFPPVVSSDAFMMPAASFDPLFGTSRAYASSSQTPISPIPAAPLPVSMKKEGAFPSDRDVTSSEHISEAPFADEHKWRKYGQKQVKRSPYPRNYYKCTVSGCPAKKHLEKFWDASANRERCRTIYLGEHVHPVAASPQVFASTQQDFQNNVLAQSAKIRAMSGSIAASVDSADIATQQRLVVECGSQVDENEDGYYWRKYGQKSVKGSSTPRQYYRCRVTNCLVKKTVEASPKGNTIVTYDGCHTHEHGYHQPISTDSSHPASPCSSHSISPSPLHHHQQIHPHQQLQQQQQNGALPPLRLLVKFEPREDTFCPYPTSSVESPSSSFSTTDEEESYLSEPSPKRAFKDEDVSYDDSYHQFAPDAPTPETWYHAPVWDANSELLTH